MSLARTARKAVRTLALKWFAEMRTGFAQIVAETPHDRIYVFADGPHGVSGGGGGGDVASFLERGEFVSSGGKRGSTLFGLVPDGVASITLEYPRRVGIGRYYKPIVYRSALRRTVRVQQNAISVHVPRGAGEALPPRMVWRDAAGTVLRVVKRPNLGLPTG